MPHEDHITALCFGNAEKSENPTLVTASKDGHFKVWILTDDSDIYSKLIKSSVSKECTILRIDIFISFMSCIRSGRTFSTLFNSIGYCLILKDF